MKDYQEKNLVGLLITLIITMSIIHLLQLYFTFETGVKHTIGIIGFVGVVLLAKSFADGVMKNE